MESNTSCALCLDPVVPIIDHISFSCDHILCFKCFPYIIYKILNSSGYTNSFFNTQIHQYECLICPKGLGKVSLETEKIIEIFGKCFQKPNLKEDNNLCEACAKTNATSCCFGCSGHNFCDGCLERTHKDNKAFEKHKIVGLEEGLLHSSKSGFLFKCNFVKRNAKQTIFVMTAKLPFAFIVPKLNMINIVKFLLVKFTIK